MDLRFTGEEIAFRDEVRAFVRAQLPASIRDKVAAGRHPSKDDMVRWTRILAAKGWSVPHWPAEWGGTGWSPIKLLIFNDELQKANAPESLAFGTSMVGPVIYTFGSQAQKQRFLPRIVDLSEWWCQGFSEPGAGSDLAGLRTTAKRDGDAWVIEGQKTWTTLAQYADWIFVLARTDPSVKKQEGISFILVDMKSPGVTVRPIQTIDGGSRGQRGVLRRRARPHRQSRRQGEQGLGLRQIPARQRAQRHRPGRHLQGAAGAHPRARGAGDLRRPAKARRSRVPHEARGDRGRAEGAGDDADAGDRGRGAG